MRIDEAGKPEGAPERSPNAGEGAPSGVEETWLKSISVQRKMAIAARLLHGEQMDLVARRTNFFVGNSLAPECALFRCGNGNSIACQDF